MTLDPTRLQQLTVSGRRQPEPRATTSGSATARPTPRARQFRLTVDLPPAVHTELSRWVIDLEEQCGRNVDKRAVVLALLELLHTDDQVAASVRAALLARA